MSSLRALARRRRAKRATAPSIADAVILYERLLGRTPSQEEVDDQLAGGATLGEILDAIVGSAEFAERQRATATGSAAHANIYHPDLARWAPRPGTWSPDGVAVVGHDGWLFLGGGTNAVLDQFRGWRAPPPDWLAGWRALVEQRAADAAAAEVTLGYVVVPDKLAILEEHFPQAIERRGPRPIQWLTNETGLPLEYPLAALRDAHPEVEVSRRTDTHLTVAGNHLVHLAALNAIDAGDQAGAQPVEAEHHLRSGDLGQRFQPQILEVARNAAGQAGPQMVENTYPEFQRWGRQVGTRQVHQNAAAPDARTAVIFGDSHAFTGPRHSGLAWFLAQAFRRVHFVWLPCGWDPDYVRTSGAQVVICETAERFLARVPPVRGTVPVLPDPPRPLP